MSLALYRTRMYVAILSAGAAVFLVKWHLGAEQLSVCNTRRQWAAGSGAAYSRFLGTKTPYSLLRQIKEEEQPIPVLQKTVQDRRGCQVMKMYGVVRHGARYPTTKRAAETGKIKAMLIAKLGLPFVSDQSNVPPEFYSDLSEEGMIEQYCLAIRLKAKLPQLLQQPYSRQHYDLRSSQTSRTLKSALSFAAGLFRGQGPLDGYQPIDVTSEPLDDDHILRFDEFSCPLYDRLLARNISLAKDWLSSPAVHAIRDHLQNTLNPSGELLDLSVDEVWSVYKVCVDDSVQLGRESHWCQLLSPSHVRTLHQINNIKVYWRKGGGFPITGLRSVHLVKDMLDFMANNSQRKVALRFGHSETLLPLLAFLKIPSSDLEHFDTTRLSPFSANALFYLYNCSSHSGGSNDVFLGFELNESPVELGLCPRHARGERRGLCPLQQLAQAAAEKTQQWKSRHQLCGLPPD